jgi:selT/selW/selH-like putative selenoprotein
LKAALEDAFSGIEVELIRSDGGAFEIRHEGKLIYSKLETGQFPEWDTIIDALK